MVMVTYEIKDMRLVVFVTRFVIDRNSVRKTDIKTI